MSKHQDVEVLLAQLQRELERNGHWQIASPSVEALASTEPFAIDTLTCTEWLQWIFIPKMQFFIEHMHPLPVSFSISPYVEEALQGAQGHEAITRVSIDIDALFSLSSQ
ncbi:pseudouridine synthase [Enterovibrio norvegicus FF-162]|uniref:YqcC family protein n=1 Tax=Enterovibrio norvegicus TaxID=188144 RepID=UPI00047486EE|nr:YqcC family protein [Enterovibrio norvegicus]OEE74336.1 pseudouridine synthase [Enterovibrio norvegicus FF-162]